MLYCQSEPDDHRAAAVYALTFARPCGHVYPARMLACLHHGAELRARPRTTGLTPCERCSQQAALALVRIEDVLEERIVVTVLRSTLEGSAHSPVTFAYDRAGRVVTDRGLVPITSYRAPVRWEASPLSGRLGADLLEAHVTMAVTLPELSAEAEPAVSRAG
jgi:hypothetical protein